jgi:hypothetical protein
LESEISKANGSLQTEANCLSRVLQKSYLSHKELLYSEGVMEVYFLNS